MLVFTQHKKQLSELKEKPFKLEKDIQTLFEANLEYIMSLIKQTLSTYFEF